MLKTTNGRTKLFSYISAAVMLCMVILLFVPFWHYNGQSSSINAYVWWPTKHAELESWFAVQTGTAVTVGDVMTMPIIQLVAGIFGIAFCLIKPTAPVSSAFTIVCGLTGLYGYLTNPVLRLGSLWVLNLIISIILLVIPLVSMYLRLKKREQTKETRLEQIQTLGETKVKKGSKLMYENTTVNQLIVFLKDEDPDCRIAALKYLAQTSNDSVFTNVSHTLTLETDERVSKEMRNTLASIRENINREHAEKA